MSESAEGIVEKAATFTGTVRGPTHIILIDDTDKTIPNAKCKVTFQDGQTITVESDGDGVLKFIRKTRGEFDIELLEEEEDSTESSEGGV